MHNQAWQGLQCCIVNVWDVYLRWSAAGTDVEYGVAGMIMSRLHVQHNASHAVCPT